MGWRDDEPRSRQRRSRRNADGEVGLLGRRHVDAFDAGALDYVVKPVTGARLAKAIDRCRRVPIAPTFDRIPIATRAGVVLVDPPDGDRCWAFHVVNDESDPIEAIGQLSML